MRMKKIECFNKIILISVIILIIKLANKEILDFPKEGINYNNNTNKECLLFYSNQSDKYSRNEFHIKNIKYKYTLNDLINSKNEANKYVHINKNDIKDNNYEQVINPKISLIITLYNQEKFIPIIYYSILKQTLKEIEIIFINDGSDDNPYNLLEKYMSKDKRIIYKENKINKGAFYSRIQGIKDAKGEYILLLDSDDFIVNDILKKLYETSTKFNLDILQFYMLIKNNKGYQPWTKVKYKSGILYQPQIKDIFYCSITRNLADKFVRRDIYLKSLVLMDEKFKNERFFVHDDDVQFFGLIRVANSYGFLENIGYYYRSDIPNSRMKSLHFSKNTNKVFRSVFSIMEYYLEKSDDNSFEKKLIAYNFFWIKVFNLYQKDIDHLTGEFEYIINVINLYLNCPFFDKKQKYYLFLFKKKVQKKENEVKNK